jgi:hypothetical protein
VHAIVGDASHMVMQRLPDIVNRSLVTPTSRAISSGDVANGFSSVLSLMNPRA